MILSLRQDHVHMKLVNCIGYTPSVKKTNLEDNLISDFMLWKITKFPFQQKNNTHTGEWVVIFWDAQYSVPELHL